MMYESTTRCQVRPGFRGLERGERGAKFFGVEMFWRKLKKKQHGFVGFSVELALLHSFHIFAYAYSRQYASWLVFQLSWQDISFVFLRDECTQHVPLTLVLLCP